MTRGVEELISAGYAWEMADAGLLHADLTLVDLAHVLELRRLGEMPHTVSTALIAALLDLVGTDSSHIDYDPALGEPYLAREHHLEGHVGPSVGWLRAGRTRREAVRTAQRMVVRRHILALVAAGADLVQALADVGELHAETVAPDHTYLQVAEPTSFGHYLLSFADPVLRDLVRLQAEFPSVNLSPVGAGAVAGSTVLRDRDRLGHSLGFDGPVPHIRDGMWASDPFTHATLAATTLVVGIDRLAEDLEILTSAEFGLVRLGDGLVRESVMMPQKRNPYALSVIRGSAGILIGRATGQLALAKAPSARSDTAIYSYGEVPRALDLATRNCRLAAAIIRELYVDVEAMARAASPRALQATSLATVLMRGDDLDYRTAHSIVSRALEAAAREGRELVRGDLVSAAGEAGHALTLDDVTFAEACDPVRTVHGRDVLGGSAPSSVREQARRIRTQADDLASWASALVGRIESAEANLVNTASKELIGGPAGEQSQGGTP